jgi:hypothetical protein
MLGLPTEVIGMMQLLNRNFNETPAPVSCKFWYARLRFLQSNVQRFARVGLNGIPHLFKHNFSCTASEIPLFAADRFFPRASRSVIMRPLRTWHR